MKFHKIILDNQQVMKVFYMFAKELLFGNHFHEKYKYFPTSCSLSRVSTLDKEPDPETQLLQLREYAKRRNFEIIGEFIDYASSTNEVRNQYKLMMEAAKKRKLDVVLVWRYDRFARSTQALVNALKEFKI